MKEKPQIKRVSYKKFNKLSKLIKKMNRYVNSLGLEPFDPMTKEQEEICDKIYIEIMEERDRLAWKGIKYNIVKDWEPEDPMRWV